MQYLSGVCLHRCRVYIYIYAGHPLERFFVVELMWSVQYWKLPFLSLTSPMLARRCSDVSPTLVQRYPDISPTLSQCCPGVSLTLPWLCLNCRVNPCKPEPQSWHAWTLATELSSYVCISSSPFFLFGKKEKRVTSTSMLAVWVCMDAASIVVQPVIIWLDLAPGLVIGCM